MYDVVLKQLEKREKPIDLIVSGLGFMGFGFLSNLRQFKNVNVKLLISRRPIETKKELEKAGITNIQVTDDLEQISMTSADVFLEMTGTTAYGTETCLKALESGKHVVTMNPELQVTTGTKLKQIADSKNLIFTDVLGDQPGSIARLINYAKIMGFKVLVAGNMKRYMNHYATQKEMKPWAEDKGLAVRQTTSFTDGTKQAIEMNLVSNYFGMTITQTGMKGPECDDIRSVLNYFENGSVSKQGIVDYAIGLKLFPGVFVIVEHPDPNQKKYLRYLNMGEGPRYVLFEPYHLCHLEVLITILNVVLFKEPTINNGDAQSTMTVAIAKSDLKKGETLDGIGGDLVRGDIIKLSDNKNYLPVGLSDGAVLKKDIGKDEMVSLDDVDLPENAATKLLNLI